MKTLDRYIIKQFLINFGILFLVMMSLFVVVDLIVDIDEFVQAGEAHAEMWYGSKWTATLATIIDYYGPVVLLLYVFCNGLIVVAAMGFTITGLQRHRELTAVIASGISLYRVAAPVLVTGVILSALTLPVQEFILPPLAPKLLRSKSQLKDPHKGLESKEVYYANAGGQNLLSAASFEVRDKKLTGVRILERDSAGITTKIVYAKAAYWNSDLEQWDFVEGYAEEPLSVMDDGTRQPRKVLEAKAYRSDLSPTVLQARRNALFANLLSLRDLERLASNKAVTTDQRLKIQQIVWSRFSLMVLNVLILVMGIPFFLRRMPGDMLKSSLRAAMVCIGAWAGGLILLQGTPFGMPALAAWLPVIIYLPVSAFLLQTVKS